MTRTSSATQRNSAYKRPVFTLFITLFLLLFTVGCDIDLEELLLEIIESELGASETVVQETTAGGGRGDWYEIYFTSAACPPTDQRRGGIDEIIAADIRQAQQRVDVAAYEFESPAMADALIELHIRGLPVRVVTDSDNTDRPSIGQLRGAGVTVVEDQRSAFMHNKFVVIDSHIVWTGSMNFTPNDVYCNNNNMVRIQSSRLATNYKTEMDEKYEDGLFGPTSPDNTPYEQLLINDVRVENYFGPEKRMAPIITERIGEAQHEILFMAFSFTLQEIGEAMIARAQAGVTIQGVFERTGSETQFSYLPPMRAAGLATLEVRQDGNPRTMHHKVIIVDRQTVIFGSFNFSANANDRNDENIIIVHDPVFAGYFVEEFNAVWDVGRQ